MVPRNRPSGKSPASRAAALAEAAGGRAGGAAAAAFVRRYYANVPPADIAHGDPATLAAAALGFWRFGRTRRPGETKIRVFVPRVRRDGWESRHTVIEAVTDDMPFLVDSLTAELNRRGAAVQLVIHPILRIVRDRKGAAREIVAPGAGARFDGTPAESFMHFEVDAQGASATPADIEAGVGGVLADVRAAVEDWPAMSGRAASIVADIRSRPPNLPDGEAGEAIAFLDWIAADHFTFLGYREMKVTGTGARLQVKTQPGGLGILRDPKRFVMETWQNFRSQPREIRAFVTAPILLAVNKANRRSTVHRPVHLDVVMVKTFDAANRVAGLHMIVGLFTSVAYSSSPTAIPLLRRKVGKVLARAGFDAASHDGKALAHILETYPRDELLQIADDELLANATGILHLQERQRIALFVRRDRFERFVTALVYVPRDRYDTALRRRFGSILADAFDGEQAAIYPQLATDSVLAQVLFIIKTVPGAIPAYDVGEITARLVEAARSWSGRLREALVAECGEERGLALHRTFGEAFDPGYRDRYPPAAAIRDIGILERTLAGGGLGIDLYRLPEDAGHQARLKLFAAGNPIPLSEVLPMMEHMGLHVDAENPFPVAIGGQERAAWIHEFKTGENAGAAIDIDAVKAKFEDAFARIWRGEVEDDGFNRLVIGAGLDWRQIVVLRACCRYLRQARIAFSQDYMEETLAANPAVARLVVELFEARFDPAAGRRREVRCRALRAAIEERLGEVVNLDEDRILRRFVNLVEATLRTNFYQAGADGAPKPYVSFKFDSREIAELPAPRPWREVFVYGPHMEGVHLRGGPVARGGIRWSDRREDFRTEILGLVKAQMVKNAVIVPVGSKGGFVCKRLPADGGREALTAEVVRCYRTLMRGLLDITDNLKGAAVVPPAGVVRHDGDDPYLVVAADKGTATFSDIANGVSRDYGFWLGDAFASGGSDGYDHKKMGITARGAWESVKRHFRETGTDIQSAPFSVVGVGDMSGDVFGNGMLLSRHIRLVGAFNHLHVFVDPDPDIAASFRERRRLFRLARSGWHDYDAKLISAGGGIFDRRAKAIAVTPQMTALFGLEADSVTPGELIRAMLGAEVDLLWFGGIGTYVKAAGESHADAGDRANDAVRLDGREVRARVIGEGANLGVTQRGRIEFAARGGRINTDFIDNSAGVDCSDHEVNIKILLDDVVAGGGMTLKARNRLLVDMTDEVSRLVLADNYLQTQAISQATSRGWAGLDVAWRMMRALERSGRLDREIEFLPDDEAMAERRAGRRGLTRPEYAVLFSYAKIVLYDQLLPTGLPDVPYLARDIARYFPRHLRARYADAIGRHRLRREIIATYITNSMVNRMGAAFVHDMQARSGLSPEDVARAFVIARDAFGLRPVWRDIEALDNRVPAATQIAMSERLAGLVERGTLWFLRNGRAPLDIEANIGAYGPGIALIAGRIGDMLTAGDCAALAAHAAELAGQGVPAALARQVAALDLMVPACDIVRIAHSAGTDVSTAGRVYFALGARLGIDWARAAAREVKAETEWQRLAVGAVVDDSYGHQAELTARVLDGAGRRRRLDVARVLDAWLERNRAGVARTGALFGELRTAPEIDIAMLTVANRQLRTLVAG